MLFQIVENIFLIIGPKPDKLRKEDMVIYSESFLIEFSNKIFYEPHTDQSLQFIIHIFPAKPYFFTHRGNAFSGVGKEDFEDLPVKCI